jgi:D-proline reductase (dithiol) PrdB
MNKTVDSFRFIDGISKRLLKVWVAMEKPREIPWTPLSKDLSECTVALLSTAGIALKTDRPFDQEGERQNPWWGDPSFRILPNTATENDVRLYHLHIDPSYAERDLNCLFPLQRLTELERAGEIGRSAPSHYSIMGYILQPETLLKETTPAIIRHLQAEQVDAVVLVPV